jgi:hypothetical protein
MVECAGCGPKDGIDDLVIVRIAPRERRVGSRSRKSQLDRIMAHGRAAAIRTARDTAKRKEAVSVLGAHGYH